MHSETSDVVSPLCCVLLAARRGVRVASRSGQSKSRSRLRPRRRRAAPPHSQPPVPHSSARRSRRRRSSRRQTARFKAGRTRARAWPRRGGRASEFDTARRSAARVAIRRPDRAADPGALRSAGRSDQHLRAEGAARATVHREAAPSQPRSTSCWRCPPPSTAGRRRRAEGHGRSRPRDDRARHPDSAQRAGAVATSSCSRGGCTTSSKGAAARHAYLPMIQNVFRAEACRWIWPTCRSSRARSSRTRCRGPRPRACGSS